MGQIAAARLVSVALSYRGTDYCRGGGHQVVPAAHLGCFDCSGLTRTVYWVVAGVDLLNGSSETQFAAAVGGLVPDNEVLLPGDDLFLVGAPLDPPPGHTGIVVAYDPVSKTGTYVSAYDTALGTVVEQFSRFGGFGPGVVMGATRPANTIPDPTPPVEDTVGRRLVQDPVNHGWWLVDEDRKCGIPTPTDLATLQAEGIPTAVLSSAELAGLTTVPWGSL